MTRNLASLFDLTGRVAAVTGGSRGLGIQIESALGDYAATIALAARQRADLDEVVTRLAEAGTKAMAFKADLSSPEAAEALTHRATETFGRIDVLVNNAGVTWGAPAEDHPLACWNKVWSKVMNLNVTGLFLLTQPVAKFAFLPQGSGTVVNVASVEGLLGHHPGRLGTIAYNTAKGAVINMTRALAAEWGPRHIRVKAVAPGFFPSRLTAATVAAHEADIVGQTPLGKLGGDTDLMGPVLLRASDAGGHITGQVIVVDGGATAI